MMFTGIRKKNNAYFLKEAFIMILVGFILCLPFQGFQIQFNGTILLTASLIFALISKGVKYFGDEFYYKYNKKYNINEVHEEDYDSDFAKNARKLKYSELKENPRYYQYISNCIERRVFMDRMFWNILTSLTLILSVYMFSGNKIYLLGGLGGFIILAILKLKYNLTLNKREPLSAWEMRTTKMFFGLAMSMAIIFGAIYLFFANNYVSNSIDAAFLKFILGFCKNHFSTIACVGIVGIIKGIYLNIMLFYSDPPNTEEGITGIKLIVASVLFLGLAGFLANLNI